MGIIFTCIEQAKAPCLRSHLAGLLLIRTPWAGKSERYLLDQATEEQ